MGVCGVYVMHARLSHESDPSCTHKKRGKKKKKYEETDE